MPATSPRAWRGGSSRASGCVGITGRSNGASPGCSVAIVSASTMSAVGTCSEVCWASSTLERCAAFFSQRDFLRRGFPTDDLSAWCAPDGDRHGEILCDLETVIPGFLIGHGGGWCDPYGRGLVFGEPCQLLP